MSKKKKEMFVVKGKKTRSLKKGLEESFESPPLTLSEADGVKHMKSREGFDCTVESVEEKEAPEEFEK